MIPTRAAWMALLTVWCWRPSSSDAKYSTSAASRLYNMLQFSQRNAYVRTIRSHVDLRGNRIFHSDPRLECCPTITRMVYRRTGINPQGTIMHLLHMRNFTQMIYETFCHPRIKDEPCQFIDERYAPYARCEEQYSYQYAVVRDLPPANDQLRVDFIRVATGCECICLPVLPINTLDLLKPGRLPAFPVDAIVTIQGPSGTNTTLPQPHLVPESSICPTANATFTTVSHVDDFAIPQALVDQTSQIKKRRAEAYAGQLSKAERIVKRSRVDLTAGAPGDNVAIPIPRVDRGRGDPRNILGVIVNRDLDNDQYKIAVKAGIFKGLYSRISSTSALSDY